MTKNEKGKGKNREPKRLNDDIQGGLEGWLGVLGNVRGRISGGRVSTSG